MNMDIGQRTRTRTASSDEAFILLDAEIIVELFGRLRV